MKTIQLGNREITMVGSPLAPFFYKKFFKQSLSGDLIALKGMETDPSKFDDVNILQMIYAMEYTHKMGKDMKDFEGWLAEFEYFDISSVVADVTEEAMNATFRSTKA